MPVNSPLYCRAFSYQFAYPELLMAAESSAESFFYRRSPSTSGKRLGSPERRRRIWPWRGIYPGSAGESLLPGRVFVILRRWSPMCRLAGERQPVSLRHGRHTISGLGSQGCREGWTSVRAPILPCPIVGDDKSPCRGMSKRIRVFRAGLQIARAHSTGVKAGFLSAFEPTMKIPSRT
jgi:hypothetical protein